MRCVSEKEGLVVFENFIKASEVNTNRSHIFNVGSVFDSDVYKIFKVVEAYNWERYDRKHYKSIIKPLMLFEKKLSTVVISYLEDFTYFIEYEKDASGNGVKNLKIIKHMEDYEEVNELLGFVYVKSDSFVKITDGNEVGRIIEELIKQGWKLKMLA
jgi:hypothetical protein